MIVATVFKKPTPGIGIAHEVGSYQDATKAAMDLVKQLTGKKHTKKQEQEFEECSYLLFDKDQTRDKREIAIQLISTEDNGQFM